MSAATSAPAVDVAGAVTAVTGVAGWQTISQNEAPEHDTICIPAGHVWKSPNGVESSAQIVSHAAWFGMPPVLQEAPPSEPHRQQAWPIAEDAAPPMTSQTAAISHQHRALPTRLLAIAAPPIRRLPFSYATAVVNGQAKDRPSRSPRRLSRRRAAAQVVTAIPRPL